jgi:signal transduction histidine kinase
MNNFTAFRHLHITGNAHNRGFSISILHPLDDTHILIQNIIDVLLLMLLFVFLSLLGFNFIISKKIWKPFYNTLFQIRNYDIKTRNKLILKPSDISEFDTLNKVLTNMANKIENDFINLKEFTENASHEIQTPLAIIKSKLEILIQSTTLTREQIELVQTMDHAVSRLSKLNGGLLLIAKIENNQYEKIELVFLGSLIRKSIETLDDFIRHKNLLVRWEMEEMVSVNMNPVLADILVNNLINNAIKHNICDGYITIMLSIKGLTIENSGIPLVGNSIDNPSDLFNRFKKNSMSVESIGLGLAIVKKICDAYLLSLSYTIKDNIHSVSILYPNKE